MTTASPIRNNASSAGNAASNEGADFRGTQPKTQPLGEPDGSSVPMESSGRFGMAGKPTQKVSFRIFSNLMSPELSLRPYGGLSKEGEFCIKPGGVNGAIKPFTATSGRKQYKKVGIRVEYSFKQLLSVRAKFHVMPSEIDTIPTVLEEGLGVFEVLEAQKVSPSSFTSKLRQRNKLPSASKTGDDAEQSTGTAFESSDRYDKANDDKAANLRNSGPTSMSKLKRKTPSSPSAVSNDTKPAPPSMPEPVAVEKQEAPPKAPDKTPSLSSQSRRKIRPRASDNVESSQSTSSSITTSRPETPRAQPSEPVAAPVKKSTGPSLSSESRGWGGRRRNRERGPIDPMAQLHKQITVRLNKITMDNFETLAGQLEEIFDAQITSTEQLTKLVSLIFEKTVQEHVYGPLYSKLCVTLSSKEKFFDEVVFGPYGRETRQVDFKNVLVKVCQVQFQKGKRPPQFTDDMDAQDRENEKIKVKKILLGTMKFIGQLYLSHLLPHKVMTLCLKHLIAPPNGKPTDDDVESACTLLSTVGPAMDEDELINRNELNKYYQKLMSISKSGQHNVRIKILIQNLLDLRKKSWSDSRAQKVEGPKQLKKKKKSVAVSHFDDYDEDIPIMMEQFIGAGDDAMEMITPSIVPISAHVVGQSERQFSTKSRYQSDGQSQRKRRTETRSGTRTKRRTERKLLMTQDEETAYVEEEPSGSYDYDMPSMAAAPVSAAQPASSGIGRRKSRVALSASSARPCDDGKTPDEEKLSDLMGDFLGMRANEQDTIKKLVSYKMADRVGFIHSTIQRAIDSGKGERLSQFIPKLLDEYILLSPELDEAMIKFFSGYTYEDNPQINKLTPQLLAPLLVDNELDFSELLGWIVLDTRNNQPEDELEYYDKDGIRNCIRGSKTITKALELLGYLFKELKEVCFDDSEYVKKLLTEHRFEIDNFMDQSDLTNKAAVQKEWIDKYGLKFAFD